MTLIDLKTILDSYISGSSLKLPSTDNKLASTSVNNLLNTYWGGVLRGTIVQKGSINGDLLVYVLNFDTKGFTLYQQAATVSGQLDFSIVNNNVELRLTFNPDDNYSFSNSFPVLNQTPMLTLNRVLMNNTVVTINSQQPGSLGFQAALVVNDLFTLASWMIGTPPTLTGSIQLQQTANQTFPVINVNSGNLVELNFGIFKLLTKLRVQSLLTTLPNNDPSYWFANEVALITAFTANNFTLPVALALHGPEQHLLAFNLDRSGNIPSLDALSGLSGFMGADPQSLITVDLPWSGAKFSIDDLNVVFDIRAKQLVSIGISVSFELSWTIIPNVIELQKIGAIFNIADPAQPKASNVAVLLYADMVLGPLMLATSVDVRTGVLIAGMQDGTSLDVNTLIGTFAKDVKLPGNDQLSIVKLEFSAQVGDNPSYYFEADAVGQLIIVNGLVIDEISFLMSYENNALADVRFGSQLTFTNTGVDVFLQAAYHKVSGWNFSGSTGPGQQIPMGTLIKDLVSLFGMDGVPDWINGATVSDIALSFNNSKGEFNFSITTTIPVVSAAMNITLNIALTKTSKVITGTILIAGLEFSLIAANENNNNIFIATYQASGGPSSISLKQLVSGISPSLGDDIPEGIKLDLKDAKFIFADKHFAIGVDLGASFDLSNLPIIGNELPASLSINVDHLQILYSSTTFTTSQTSIINTLLPAGISPLPATPAKGIQVTGKLDIGSLSTDVNIGAAAGTTKSVATMAAAAVTTTSSTPSIQWFNIQRTFGPVNFQRIGVSFSDNTLLFSLDAAIMIGPVTFSVEGLSFGSPINSFRPEFDIHGLGLSYISPRLTIFGSILKIPEDQLPANIAFQYDGMVSVKAGEWGLTALASYAQMSGGSPSLFVFAALNATLGGPPFFIVTGLMGGFGYNRSLQLPNFDEVTDFPLLAIGSTTDPLDVLAIMEGQKPGHSGKTKQWIAPQAGEYWLAAGISFSSFEIVQGQLLLAAEFGHELAFALLGLASLRLPQGASDADSYVFVELQLAAVLKPNEGYLSVGAALTGNSFLITKDCHLTGGFAFCMWFGTNVNAGQFVTTVGGYHHAFNAPSYYPKVSRLGFNWIVDSRVTIKGDAYFAITPSCAMAGGGLEILFNSGDLRAWFTAQADLMLTWHPFSFYADISIEIGVSYRLNLGVCHKTISLSLGAAMDFWGPPTGGRVKVHICIVSFTVAFGAEDPKDQNNQALLWKEFKALLPAAADVCKIVASTGLYKTMDDNTWVVRSGSFSFLTQTVIPASSTNYLSGHQTVQSAVNTQGINIRPMNHTGVISTHLLEIYYEGCSVAQDLSSWNITTAITNMPEALWGQPLKDGDGNFIQNPAVPTANVVPAQLNGFTVTAPSPVLGDGTGLIPMKLLLEEYILLPDGQTPQGPLSVAVKPVNNFMPVFNSGSITNIAGSINNVRPRNAIFDILQMNEIYKGGNSNMALLAANAGNLFSDAPMERS
ncbi:DUF6603 domain-containing protein [Chitinophaga sancti]|uniref:DUF6603 domain-containing protein n=1 Tax=Chitinophaga sancti TaxID=1004 RepID=UPI003F7ACA08